jgi:arylsulfatase
LTGYTAAGKTFKVHLDGYNMLPLLTGQTTKDPRETFLYFNDDAQLTALRYDNWKMIFMEQRAPVHCEFGQNLLLRFVYHYFLIFAPIL